MRKRIPLGMMRSSSCASLLLFVSVSAYAQQSAAPALAHGGATHDATAYAGADIGERINTALETCKHQCTVRVPEGNYTYATTIHLPLMSFGLYSLVMQTGAVLTYTGAGDAISAPSNGLSRADLLIAGGELVGNPQAKAGVHMFPTNRVTVRNMTIRGFSGGDGVHVEGTNTVLLLDNDITQNRVGVHLTGTRCPGNRDSSGDLPCGPGMPGNGYAPNAIHVVSNMIVENSEWGVWEDWSPAVTASLNNLYLANNLENNGRAPESGAMWLAFSRATQVIANYFEGGPHYIRIGGASFVPATGVTIRGNYFTTNASAPVSVELLNANDTMIEDNTQYDPFPNSPTPCFVDLGLENGTYLGKNHTEARSIACHGGKPVTLPPATFQAEGAGANAMGRFVGQLTTTRSAADVLKVEGLQATAHCAAFAANAEAAALTGVYTQAAAGGVTVHHSPAAGGQFNVFCSFE